MRRTRAVLVVALASVALASCGSATVAASVDGRSLSVAALNAELADVASNAVFVHELTANHEPVFGPRRESYTALFVDNILSRRITIMRVEAALSHVHPVVTPIARSLASALATQSAGGQAVFAGFPRSYQARLVHDTLAIVELEAALGHVALTTAGVEAYYRAHEAAFRTYCGSEVLVRASTEAQAVLAKLRSGASFAAVARADSAQNAQGGGVLGCGTAQQYAASFGSAVARLVTTLPLSTPSSVVQLANGFAVFEVTSRGTVPFAQGELLAADGEIAHGQVLLNEYLARTARSAAVHVNPAFGRLVIQHGVLSVVPNVPRGAALASQIVTPTKVG